MKAAVLEELNAPLALRDFELTSLDVGQVLVKVLVSGLCGSQLHEIRGHKDNSKFLPHFMGHEGCGIVEAIGPGVTTVAIGDKVVMHWRIGSGIEAPFPKYKLGDREITSGKVTTLSEYSIASENRLTAVPADTPDELCALLGCSLSTGLGIIDNEVDLKLGESVMVVGCGGVGLNVIQGAALRSAHPIIAVDITEGIRDNALALKADLYINSNTHDIREELSQQFDTEHVDVVIDTTGVPAVISELTTYLSDRGRLIMVGQPAPESELPIQNAISLFGGHGKTIKATQGGSTSPSDDIPRYVRLYNAGMLDIKTIVSHWYPLQEVNEAFDLLRSGEAGRVMIRIQDN